MEKVKYVVKAECENTVAIVTAEVELNRNIRVGWDSDGLYFLHLLKGAVVEWLQDLSHYLDEEWCNKKFGGLEGFQRFAKYFNVGDLAEWTKNVQLKKILAEYGIYKLNVKVFAGDDDNQNWTFDTRLGEEVLDSD
jgi:hypothetical protein